MFRLLGFSGSEGLGLRIFRVVGFQGLAYGLGLFRVAGLRFIGVMDVVFSSSGILPRGSYPTCSKDTYFSV